MTPTAATLKMQLRALIAIVGLALCACVAPVAEPLVARAYPEADKLFHADQRWLGGDAAISVPLSRERTLWLFGDSFVDESRPYTRAGAAFIHNTIAVENGADPRTAQMQFYWRHLSRGAPAPFFPDAKGHWYWPRGAIRLSGGPLVLFLHKIKSAPGGLGFANAGYAIAMIVNPDGDPARWRMRIVDQPQLPFDALPGSAAVLDGAYVVSLATREQGTHAGAIVRYRLDAFGKREPPDGEWWLGDAKGWVATPAVGKDGPAFVIDDAGAECSLHWDERLHAYVHVASYGFGASVIGVRTAPALTGPWSTAHVAYRPPESDAARPFVYAGKAHPELAAAPGILVTYVANTFDPKTLVSPEGEQTLYWPHFVAIPIDNPQ
jgi:hypothetical protein